MAKSVRKIDVAWEAINREYAFVNLVEENALFYLTADEIGGMRTKEPNIKFEPRLLTHFDNKNQQPNVFNKNELSILPVERGSYVIGNFSPFIEIEKNPETIETVHLSQKIELQSLSQNLLINETMGLNFADANGVFEDFIGEPLVATVAGRQKGGNWNYSIKSKGKLIELKAENPQIEIDAGYEGKSNLVLIEAKNKLVSEFCLRQLYFPLRAWREKVNKQIKTVFACINNGEIYLYEYIFPEPFVFHAELLRAKRYIIDPQTITKNEIVELFKEIKPEQEPEITFPQANSILRTLEIVEMLAENEISQLDENNRYITPGYIKEVYGIHDRQGYYYGDSCAYLGFATIKETNGQKCYIPTKKAIRYAELSKKQKQLFACKQILSKPVFNEVFKVYLNRNVVMSTKDMAQIVAKYRPDLSKGTPKRRSSTARKWLNWIVSLFS